MVIPREMYIPKGATKIAPKCGGVVFYAYSDKAGRPCAMCFIGKQSKPAWHYAWRNDAARFDRISDQIKVIEKRQADKAARRAEANKPHGMEVGQILVSSWGYDQTNVYFYEIVELIGKTMVKLERIGAQRATDSGEFGHGMAQHVVPDPEVRTGEFYRSKAGKYGAAGKYGYKADVWSGKPIYQSWYA